MISEKENGSGMDHYHQLLYITRQENVATEGTKLFNCLPPPKSLSVPFCEVIIENKLGIMFNLVASFEYP